jgi:phosphatidylinositol alpha-1,6-mannosyltransferase
MRLLFVTQDFPPDVGGIQTYSKELAPRLAARCERVLLLAPARPNDDAVDAALDVPVERLPVRPDLLVLGALPHIVRRTRHESFDVAFHVQWQTAFASLLARRITGSPSRVAVTLHGKDTVFNPFRLSPLRWGYDALRRIAISGADHVLPVSRFLGRRAQALGATDDQITVVPNATSPDVFYPDPAPALRKRLGAEDRSLVLSAGRLVPKKGFDTALRAIDRVRTEIPDVLLLIAGEGPERSFLKRLVRDLELEDHVHFLGGISQDALRHYYSEADVFLMAGRETAGDVEGFGLVYLEANACGTPVVGARVGGVPDAVWHEETGLLVPPESPSATADALLRLLRSPDFARRLGEQGRDRVRTEANWDHVADRIYELLRRETA